MFPDPEARPALDDLLDLHRVRVEQLRMVDAWRARGRADAVKLGPDLLTKPVPISAEIAALIEKRLHQLAAARETVVIESASFLHVAPALQESAERRVSAAEAALKAAGVPADQLALDPVPAEDARPSGGGLLRRLFDWLMEPDDNNGRRVEELRKLRKQALRDLRDVERQSLEAHTRHQNAEAASEQLAQAECALAKELWAAYQNGVQNGLPAGAADLSGDLDCGEMPEVEVPAWVAEESVR